ncbi:MAG: CvpA family protein [Legionellaceae bacterium]|nr:CvpA family protein [Legionellaceae bacterium]
MMAWHWMDYAIIALVGLSVFTGLMRGFVKELIALGIWIIAIWLGFKYSPVLSAYLKPHIPDATLRGILSFVALLFGTLVIGGLLNMLLSLILNRSGLKGTDRLLGMGFGFVRGTFIVALLIGVMNLTSLANDKEFNHSKIYARFKPLSVWMFGFMPNIIDKVHALENKDKPESKTENKSKEKPKDEPKDELKYDFEEIDIIDGL